MTNLCSCNFSFVELWCAGGWAGWALQCASWCAPWVPCMMSIDMFTMVCRVNIAVCSMVCVISIAVCKLAQIRNTRTSLHKTPIQPRQCLQFSIRNVLHFNIYLWQIFLQNQKSDQKQNNLFCHFLFAKCTLSSWISSSTVLNAVHLTGEDPWKPMQLSIMKKYLCCICYSLNIGYSWMRSENPCILNISSRQQCALCNHDIVSVWKSIQKKHLEANLLTNQNWQGGVEDGWIMRVTPIRTSCRLTKRCDPGITACGINRKNSTIGTKNSRNILIDIFWEKKVFTGALA